MAQDSRTGPLRARRVDSGGYARCDHCDAIVNLDRPERRAKRHEELGVNLRGFHHVFSVLHHMNVVELCSDRSTGDLPSAGRMPPYTTSNSHAAKRLGTSACGPPPEEMRAGGML